MLYRVVFLPPHGLIFHHWVWSCQGYPEYCCLKAQSLMDIFSDLNHPRYYFLQHQRSLDSPDELDRVADQNKTSFLKFGRRFSLILFSLLLSLTTPKGSWMCLPNIPKLQDVVYPIHLLIFLQLFGFICFICIAFVSSSFKSLAFFSLRFILFIAILVITSHLRFTFLLFGVCIPFSQSR